VTGFGQAEDAALEACVAPGPAPSMVITVSPGGTYTRKLWDDLAALTATGSPEPAQAGLDSVAAEHGTAGAGRR
jgi:hypothetical protein